MLIVHKGGVSFKMQNIFTIYNIKIGIIDGKTVLIIYEYNLKFFLTGKCIENTYSLSDAGDYVLNTVNINSEGDVIISIFYSSITRVYKYDRVNSSLINIYSLVNVVNVKNRYLSSTIPIGDMSIKTLNGLPSDLKRQVSERFIGNTAMIPLQTFIDKHNRTCIVINLSIKNNDYIYTIAVQDNDEIKVIEIGKIPLMEEVEPDINLLMSMMDNLRLTIDYRNITHRKKNKLTFLAAIEI